MICPKCTEDFDSICPCGYAPPGIHGVPIVRSTYRHLDPGITRQQFGETLYETIKTIGGILGLEQQRAAAIHYGEGYKIARLLARRKLLQERLSELLPQIDEANMATILKLYPWVVHA